MRPQLKLQDPRPMPSDGKIKITVQEALEHLLTRSVYQDRALLASAEVIKQLTLHLRNPGRYSEETHRTSIDQLQAAVDSLRVLDSQWRSMHAERMGQDPRPAAPEAAPASVPAAENVAAALGAVRTLPLQPLGQARAATPDLAAAFDPRRDDGAII